LGLLHTHHPDKESTVAISARNQFKGTVTSVKHGAVMSEVIVDIGGGHEIVSLISCSSAKRLKLKKGSPAVAIIKATEVLISNDGE
jgi:molybdopterin-binding protein